MLFSAVTLAPHIEQTVKEFEGYSPFG